MYFSRVTIMPERLPRKVLMNLFDGNQYAEHQLLWQLFDDDQRHYLFRREFGNGLICGQPAANRSLPVYYMVSRDEPVAVPGMDVQSKPYNPVIAEGDTFGFTLRANPIVSRKVEGKKNSIQHDVMMDAKHRAKADNVSPVVMNEMIDQAARRWLLERTEGIGIELQDSALMFDGYQKHKFYKARDGKAINISTVDYQGLLTVSDVDVFKQALFTGIGRAKAFGCGLMMIRRV